MSKKATYLGGIRLTNYKCFQGEKYLNLLDENKRIHQWTVILGNNNTGKTNLLKAIAELEPQPQEFNFLEKRKETRLIPLNYIRKLGKIKNIKESGSIYSEIYFENKKTEKRINDKEVTKYSPNWGFSRNEGWSVADVNKLNELKIYGYGVTRSYGKKGLTESNELLNSISLLENNTKLINFEEWLFFFFYAQKNGNLKAKNRLEKIKNLLIGDVFPDLQGYNFITNENLENYILFKTSDGFHQLEDLGYGYQSTLSWVIDLCKKMFDRYPRSSNPLKEPAVVLIDELDLHLHPKWQRNIISHLTKHFPKTQFIVTTHSPLIIQAINNINLFILSKTDDGIKIEKINKESFVGWTVEEILEDIMDMGNDIFTKRYQDLIEQFDQSLDTNNYNKAKKAFDELLKIIHPNSSQRKILELQLSQLIPNND